MYLRNSVFHQIPDAISTLRPLSRSSAHFVGNKVVGTWVVSWTQAPTMCLSTCLHVPGVLHPAQCIPPSLQLHPMKGLLSRYTDVGCI